MKAGIPQGSVLGPVFYSFTFEIVVTLAIGKTIEESTTEATNKIDVFTKKMAH